MSSAILLLAVGILCLSIAFSDATRSKKGSGKSNSGSTLSPLVKPKPTPVQISMKAEKQIANLNTAIHNLYEKKNYASADIESFYKIINNLKNAVNVLDIETIGNIKVLDMELVIAEKVDGAIDDGTDAVEDNRNQSKMEQLERRLEEHEDSTLEDRLELQFTDLMHYFNSDPNMNVTGAMDVYLDEYLNTAIIASFANVEFRSSVMPHFHAIEVIQIVERFPEHLTLKMKRKFKIIRNQLDRFGELDYFKAIDKCVSTLITDDECKELNAKMNTLYVDVHQDIEKEEGETFEAPLNVTDHNEAIEMIYDIISFTERNQDKVNEAPNWFMDALINGCLVEDSKNISPDNSIIKGKPAFNRTKNALTQMLLAHEGVSKLRKISLRVCQFNRSRDNPIKSEARLLLEDVDSVEKEGLCLDARTQQMLYSVHALLVKHNVPESGDGHIIDPAHFETYVAKYKNTNDTLKQMYKPIRKNPNELIRKTVGNVYTSIGKEQLRAVKTFYIVIANSQNTMKTSYADQYTEVVHNASAAEVITCHEAIMATNLKDDPEIKGLINSEDFVYRKKVLESMIPKSAQTMERLKTNVAIDVMKFLRHPNLKEVEWERDFKDKAEKEKHFNDIPEEERHAMLISLRDSLMSVKHQFYNANMQYLVGHVATFLTIPADEVFDDLRKCIGKAIEHCSILADVKRDLKRFNNNFNMAVEQIAIDLYTVKPNPDGSAPSAIHTKETQEAQDQRKEMIEHNLEVAERIEAAKAAKAAHKYGDHDDDDEESETAHTAVKVDFRSDEPAIMFEIPHTVQQDRQYRQIKYFYFLITNLDLSIGIHEELSSTTIVTIGILNEVINELDDIVLEYDEFLGHLRTNPDWDRIQDELEDKFFDIHIETRKFKGKETDLDDIFEHRQDVGVKLLTIQERLYTYELDEIEEVVEELQELLDDAAKEGHHLSGNILCGIASLDMVHGLPLKEGLMKYMPSAKDTCTIVKRIHKEREDGATIEQLMVKLIEPITDQGDPHLFKEFYLLAVEFDVSEDFKITTENQLMLKFVDFLIGKVSENTDEHITIRHSDIGFFLYMTPDFDYDNFGKTLIPMVNKFSTEIKQEVDNWYPTCFKWVSTLVKFQFYRKAFEGEMDYFRKHLRKDDRLFDAKMLAIDSTLEWHCKKYSYFRKYVFRQSMLRPVALKTVSMQNVSIVNATVARVAKELTALTKSISETIHSQMEAANEIRRYVPYLSLLDENRRDKVEEVEEETREQVSTLKDSFTYIL